jgi:hypothetical protein
MKNLGIRSGIKHPGSATLDALEEMYRYPILCPDHGFTIAIRIKKKKYSGFAG